MFRPLYQKRERQFAAPLSSSDAYRDSTVQMTSGDIWVSDFATPLIYRGVMTFFLKKETVVYLYEAVGYLSQFATPLMHTHTHTHTPVSV